MLNSISKLRNYQIKRAYSLIFLLVIYSDLFEIELYLY